MAKIISKLNLNKSPQSVENNSLIYAKNIRLLKDGSIGPEGNITSVYSMIDDTIVGHIVGNNKIYLLPSTGGKIYEYNEQNNEVNIIDTNWTYHNGVIDGCVTTNNTGEIILTICESDADDLIPIKHINLSHAKPGDESLYTQNPVVPFINLNLEGTYTKTIPNGVYQFFVRFKVRDNFYTNWLPCSKECFAGNHNESKTIQGKLRYTNIHTDASSSFVFNVDIVNEKYSEFYKSFQIGFIISHDDSTVARLWKEFPCDTKKIYFDYDSVSEYNIDDLLKVNYEIFDVKNIDFFRNKLYISNYKETNFNQEFDVKDINVSLEIASASNKEYKFDNLPLIKDDSNTYYEYYGDNKFIDLINGETSKSNFEEIITKNESEVTTTDGGGCRMYCGFDDSINPDVYWIYKIDATKSKNLFKAFGIDLETDYFDLSLTEGPFSKVLDLICTHTEYYKKGETNGSKAKSSFIVPTAKTLITNPFNKYVHPLQNIDNVSWFDGRSDSYEEFWIDSYPQYKYARFLEDKALSTELMNDYLKKFVTSIQNNIFGETRYLVTKVKLLYGAKEIVIKSVGDPSVASDYECIKSCVSVEDVYAYLNTFLTNIKGVDPNNIENYWYEDNYYKGPITSLAVEYTILTAKVSGSSDTIYVDTTKVNSSKIINLSINTSYFNNDYKVGQHNTLLPFTSYEFFIHYVKNNSIITNGTSIGVYSINQPNEKETLSILYPSFKNIHKVDNYSGWFISCIKKANEVCKCFDYYYKDGRHYVSCIEEDAMLSKSSDNITLILGGTEDEPKTITTEAKYYSSGSTDPLSMFGGTGCISWTDDDCLDVSGNLSNLIEEGMTIWLKNKSEANSNYVQQLTKITPIIDINTDHYEDYENMNLPGYAGIVYKLNNEVASSLYVVGTDVYNKETTDTDIIVNQNTSYIPNVSSKQNYIQSNFNINYLSLTEEIVPRIRNAKDDSGNFKNICLSINSLTSSDIYELQSMYRSYPRKYFSPVEDNTITEFNNTIRCSDVNTDEVYRNIFKFEATNYYNIPCNKGIIVNMFSIANNIYVHTQHSLYKFSGYTSLTAKDGEVSTKESDAFDTGISEIFDAENGFGGLSKKSHSLITYNAYIFYDASTKILYAYGGEGQMSDISRSIHKIFDKYVEDVIFVEDYYNDRFFVNIKNSNGNICLSYNFVSKSFISIHDFDFYEGFSSRGHCYFLNKNKKDIYRFEFNKICDYNDFKKTSILTYLNSNTEESCIDIIYNQDYEKIKSLNYINWICCAINDFITKNLMAEEDIDFKYAGTKLLIYSDQCNTELIDLIDSNGNPKISNNASINDTESFKYPRYNCGVWSLNYFRDIRNDNDLFKYGGYSDNKSLIYGKYFVVRFIFKDHNFKLENLHFNVNDYDKIQY